MAAAALFTRVSTRRRLAFPLLAFAFAARTAAMPPNVPPYARVDIPSMVWKTNAGDDGPTAAVVEALPAAERERAATVATIANVGGLGSGPVLAGLLVQYAPHPLVVPYVVHIVLMGLALVAVWGTMPWLLPSWSLSKP